MRNNSKIMQSQMRKHFTVQLHIDREMKKEQNCLVSVGNLASVSLYNQIGNRKETSEKLDKSALHKSNKCLQSFGLNGVSETLQNLKIRWVFVWKNL